MNSLTILCHIYLFVCFSLLSVLMLFIYSSNGRPCKLCGSRCHVHLLLPGCHGPAEVPRMEETHYPHAAGKWLVSWVVHLYINSNWYGRDVVLPFLV